jgi:hypothetical protein
MKKSKIIYSVLLVILTVNIITLSTSPAGAQSSQSLLPTEGEFTCKWSPDQCNSGISREICLRDGTGNTCTCGDVTRSC